MKTWISLIIFYVRFCFALSLKNRCLFLISLAHQNKGFKPISLEESLGVLMSGFLRGGVGFLKGTGEMIKGSSGINREVRVGVTHVRTYYWYSILHSPCDATFIIKNLLSICWSNQKPLIAHCCISHLISFFFAGLLLLQYEMMMAVFCNVQRVL